MDDEPINLDVIRGILKADYSIKAAINGERALRIMERTRPDLILLDIMMPDMDGYEVCRRLKANPATCEIPIIFLTAMIAPEAEAKGLALGAADYITKPISPPVLQARIQTQLNLKRARERLSRQKKRLQNERDLVESIVAGMRSADKIDGRNLR